MLELANLNFLIGSLEAIFFPCKLAGLLKCICKAAYGSRRHNGRVCSSDPGDRNGSILIFFSGSTLNLIMFCVFGPWKILHYNNKNY